ncbi:c-type cytochrome, partial [Helicobacter himalayensis]|uniref:c-type cytochrome n=1 Tax=Helicobacter himalayensis TaxID=1591088 RepID=UPI003D6EA14C
MKVLKRTRFLRFLESPNNLIESINLKAFKKYQVCARSGGEAGFTPARRYNLKEQNLESPNNLIESINLKAFKKHLTFLIESTLKTAMFFSIMLLSLTTSYANDYDQAVSKSLKNGGKLYKKACASCHGKKGTTLPPGASYDIPIINRSQGELVSLLSAYRTGEADKGGAKGTMSANLMRYKFTNQNIEDIAYYVASLNPAPISTKGFYYQVAAYHNEVPEHILARIAEHNYVVHITEYNGKELKRYLIGPYADTQSMQADKERIAELTEHTHVQKKMKPLVRYMNEENEIFSLKKDYSLEDSLGAALQPPQLYRAEHNLNQATKAGDTHETQNLESKESKTNKAQEDSKVSQDSPDKAKAQSKEEGKEEDSLTESQDTQNLELQDSTLKALFKFETDTPNQEGEIPIPNGYYYILATYAKTIPLDTLEKLKNEEYRLLARGDYVHIIIGGYDTKSTLLSHKTKANALTKALHIHKYQDQKPRI